MENYFVITNSNGDTRVDCISKQTLLDRINEDYYGQNITYLDSMPNESDTNYWGESVLVIKGNIVCPKEKTTVTEYTID